MAYTLVWDQAGEKIFETGAKNQALFVMKDDGTYDAPVVWNGLISVSENPTGAEPTSEYADDIKYIETRSAEELGATITAYSSPVEFDICDGQAELQEGITIGQQDRRGFAIAYVTKIGNDILDTAYGEKLHIYYGAKASPSTKEYSSINDSPAGLQLSWETTMTKIPVTGYKPTASVVIDSTKVAEGLYEQIKTTLFGDGTTPGELLMPDDLIDIGVTPETQSMTFGE